MGNAESSPDLSEHALKTTSVLDASLLLIPPSHLVQIDRNLLKKVFSEALSSGLFTSRDVWHEKKLEALTRKSLECSSVLSLALSFKGHIVQTDSLSSSDTSSADEVTVSSRSRTGLTTLSTFHRKQLKLLERTFAELTSTCDLYADVTRARSALVARAQLAFTRTLKRQQTEGKPCRLSLEQKQEWLRALVQGEDAEGKWLQSCMEQMEASEQQHKARYASSAAANAQMEEDATNQEAQREREMRRTMERFRDTVRERMAAVRAQLSNWQSQLSINSSVDSSANAPLTSSVSSDNAIDQSTHSSSSSEPLSVVSFSSRMVEMDSFPVRNNVVNQGPPLSLYEQSASSVAVPGFEHSRYPGVPSPPRSPAPSSLSSVSSPSAPSPALSALSAPLSPTLSIASFISEVAIDRPTTFSLAYDAEGIAEDNDRLSSSHVSPCSSSSPSADGNLLQSLLAHAESLPELIGLTGLLCVMHPREAAIHSEQLSQRRTQERSNANGRHMQDAGAGSAWSSRPGNSLFRAQVRRGPVLLPRPDASGDSRANAASGSELASADTREEAIGRVTEFGAQIPIFFRQAQAEAVAAQSFSVNSLLSDNNMRVTATVVNQQPEDMHDEEPDGDEDDLDEPDEPDEPEYQPQGDMVHDEDDIEEEDNEGDEDDEDEDNEDGDEDDENDDDEEHGDVDPDIDYPHPPRELLDLEHDMHHEAVDMQEEHELFEDEFDHNMEEQQPVNVPEDRRELQLENELELAMRESLQTHLQERQEREVADSVSQAFHVSSSSSATSSSLAYLPDNASVSIPSLSAPSNSSAIIPSAISGNVHVQSAPLSASASIIAATRRAFDLDAELAAALALDAGGQSIAGNEDAELMRAIELSLGIATSTSSGPRGDRVAAPTSGAMPSPAANTSHPTSIASTSVRDVGARLLEALNAASPSSSPSPSTSLTTTASSEVSPTVSLSLPVASNNRADEDEISVARPLSLELNESSASSSAPISASTSEQTVSASSSSISSSSSLAPSVSLSSSASSNRSFQGGSRLSPAGVATRSSSQSGQDLMLRLDSADLLLARNLELLQSLSSRLRLTMSTSTVDVAAIHAPSVSSASSGLTSSSRVSLNVVSSRRPLSQLEDMMQQVAAQIFSSSASTGTTPNRSLSQSSHNTIIADQASSSRQPARILRPYEIELESLLQSLSDFRAQLQNRIRDNGATPSNDSASVNSAENTIAATLIGLEEQTSSLQNECRLLEIQYATISSNSFRFGGAFSPSLLPRNNASSSSTNTRPQIRSSSSTPRSGDSYITLDENDTLFRCQELLMLVLKEAAMQSISSLRSATKVPRNFAITEHNQSPSLPMVRLLSLLQRDLFRKAAMCRKEDDPLVPFFAKYLLALFRQCCDILTRVSNEMDKEATYDANSFLNASLYRSVIGSCLPLALLAAYNLVQTPLFYALSSLAVELQHVVLLLDSLTPYFPFIGTLDQEDFARPTLSPQHVCIVETPHAYLPQMDDECSVTIAGADFLTLEFDTRCSSERGRDTLDVMNGERIVLHSLDGDLGHWPRSPLIIPGNTVSLRFHAESSNSNLRYGYRVLVCGVSFPIPPSPTRLLSASYTETIELKNNKANEEESSSTKASSEQEKLFASSFAYDDNVLMHTTPFLYDTLNLAARLFGRCARLSIVGEADISDEEKSQSRWLSSPLFSQGFEVDHPSAEECVLLQCANEPAPLPSTLENEVTAHRQVHSHTLIGIDASPILSSSSSTSTPLLQTTSSTSHQTMPHSSASKEIQRVIGSGADGVFLASFVDLTPYSDGAEYDDRMRRLIRAVGPENMGGVVVKRTVRCFVAALLKHLGLVRMARSFVIESRERELKKALVHTSDSASASALIDVWKKGALMHRWIVSQRQSLQQLHLAKLQQLEAEDKKLSPEQLHLADQWLEYEGFCAALFNKSLYLLSVRPCHASRLSRRSAALSTPALSLSNELRSTMALTRTFSNEVALVRNMSSGGRGARDTNESFLSLFSVYRTLQHFSAYKAGKKTQADRSGEVTDGTTIENNSVVDLMALFVQSVLPLQKFQTLISAQSKRAQMRLTAVEALKAFLKAVTIQTAKIGALYAFSNPFRAYQRYPRSVDEEKPPTGSHYYSKIESCDVRLRQQVRVAFLDFYSQLTPLLRDARTNDRLFALALDCWAVSWIPLDHEYLVDADILPLLHTLSQNRGSSSSSHGSVFAGALAAVVLSNLFHSQIRFEPLVSPTDPSYSTNSFTLSEDEEDEVPAASAKVLLNGSGHAPSQQPWVIDHYSSAHPGLDRLQQQIINVIFSDLYHAFQDVVKYRRELGQSGLSDLQIEQTPLTATSAFAHVRAEHLAYQALSSLCSMAASSERVLRYLVSKNVLQLLLDIIEQGSPRLQRLSISSLASQLRSFVSPTLFDEMNLQLPCSVLESASTTSQKTLPSSERLISYVLTCIGLCTVNDLRSKSTAKDVHFNPYCTQSGQISLSLASDWIAFARCLLQRVIADNSRSNEFVEEVKTNNPITDKPENMESSLSYYDSPLTSWYTLTLNAVSTAMQQLPMLTQQKTSSSFTLTSEAVTLTETPVFHTFVQAFAAVSVLGGCGDYLRVGGYVFIVSNITSAVELSQQPREVGIVVHLDRASARAKVVFDHSPNKSIDVDVNKLRPVSSDLPDVHLLESLPGMHQTFLQCLQLLESENRDAIDRKVARERKLLAELELQQSSRRQSLAASKTAIAVVLPVVEDHPWSCPVCTFLMTSSKRLLCEICGSPNPEAEHQTPVTLLAPQASLPPPKTPRSLMLESAESEEEVASRISSIQAPEFLFHVLRSRIIKALCRVLQSSPSSSFLRRSSLLPSLLSLATRPTQMSGFYSISALEAREQRLSELLIERHVGLINDTQRFSDRAKGSMLTHSPFANLAVSLPNSFDLGPSRSISFLTDDCCTVQYSRMKDAAVAVVRANHLIPNSLPLYYFEVTVLNMGEARTDSSAFQVALGLFRSGMALKGYPGASNSYAFSSLGELHSTQAGGRVHRQLFSTPFSVNDVVGCLWNLRKKTVYFTLNGRFSSSGSSSSSSVDSISSSLPAFSGVDGRFYPAVWMENEHSSLSLNWGQQPFLFDFVSTLPAGYLNSLVLQGDTSAQAATSRLRTAAEIKRRTTSEELALITSFPIDLCEIVLERSSDDMERALDFLLQNGHNELERMAAESIRQSQLMEESRKHRMFGLGDVSMLELKDETLDSDDEEDLAEWLTGGVIRSSGSAESGIAPGSRSAAALMHALQSTHSSASSSATSRSAMLDDDIEQDVPPGVELPSSVRQQQGQTASRNDRRGSPSQTNDEHQMIRASGSLQEPLKMEDISCGSLLAVSDQADHFTHSQESTDALSLGMALEPTLSRSAWSPGEHFLPITRFAGCTGIVAACNVNTKAVQLLFVDVDTGMRHCRWFPIAACAKPQRTWLDNVSADIRVAPWKSLAHEIIVNEQALSVRSVRTAMLKLLGSWPSNIAFTLKLIGGSLATMNMLKLVASELLSTSVGRSRVHSFAQPLLVAFQNRLQDLFKVEIDEFTADPSRIPSVRIGEHMFAAEKSDLLLKNLRAVQTEDYLLPRVVEEIIVHFVQAVNHPIPHAIEKSPHPYPSHSEIREKIHISGASKLLVVFDPACHISEDMLTRLAFYRDSGYQECIASCSGRYGTGHGLRWQSFLVGGDTLYYKFTSSANTDHWGYKFRVSPIEMRINDEAALNGLNIELGTWLFEFFLANTPPMLTRFYARDLYDAIVWYVCNAKPSAKSRGIELLVRFLLHMHQLENDHPLELKDRLQYRPLDFNKLAPLQMQMNQVLDSMNESDYRGLSSPALQGLIELLATTDLVKQCNSRLSNSEQNVFASSPSSSFSSAFPNVSHDRTQMLDVSKLVTHTIRVLSAQYYVAQVESQSEDVTSKLSAYVDSYGGCQLYIPTSSSVLERIIGPTHISSARERKLHIRYAIDRTMFDEETRKIEKVTLKEVDKHITIPAVISRSNAPPNVLLRPAPSPFDGVVELSRFTLQMQATGQFNEEAQQEIVRAQAIGRSFFPLVSILSKSMSETDRLAVVDCSNVQGPTFTISMWVYLLEEKQSVMSSRTSSPSHSFIAPVEASSSSPLSSQQSDSSSSADAVIDPNIPVGMLASSSFSSSLSVSSFAASPARPVTRRAPSFGLNNASNDSRSITPATNAAPLRCLLQKGNHNAELALSSSQSGGWTHAHAHLHNSGFTMCLGPSSDNRVVFTLYVFRHQPQQLISSQPLPANRWCHVAVSVSRYSARLMINGIEESSRKLQGHRRINSDPFFFGLPPVGLFDITEERYGSNVQRGAGFEDESKRTGVSMVLQDARYVGYAIDLKDLAHFYKSATKYNPAFKVSDREASVSVKWRERIVKESLRASITSSSSSSSSLSSPSASFVSTVRSSSFPSLSSAHTTRDEDKGVLNISSSLHPIPALYASPPSMTAEELHDSMMKRFSPHFTSAMDTQLIEFVSNQIETELHRQRAASAGSRDSNIADLSGSVLEVHPYTPWFLNDTAALSSYHLISHLPMDKIRARIMAIQAINLKLAVVLPLVDFSQAASSWSLAHRLSSMSWLILKEVKTRAWTNILRQTSGQGTTTFITVNRPRALRAREKGDLSGLKSVFGQIYCQLHFLRPSLLRQAPDQRPWRATFEGEGGTDAGGLFRDSVSHMCSELQSVSVPLFIPCPNNRTKVGDNQDKWIPHPASTSSVHVSMYSFVGKLMGIAIRGSHVLNLDLPSLVFKPLVGQPITRTDLEQIDSLAFDVLDKIATADAEQVETMLSELALTFTTMTSDGRVVELKEGGALLPVTSSNREEYCRMVEELRIHEFDTAVAAIRKGLSTIVPIQLLPLFTSTELESMICGKREIEIDYLRANTRYRSPISVNDRHVQMLWEVLNSFTHEERQLFIRFVWGQSRLPSNPQDFTQKFEVWPHSVNNDTVLPVSHTCFFSIELPRYSSVEIMKKKLLYAVTHSRDIDTDFTTEGINWDQE